MELKRGSRAAVRPGFYGDEDDLVPPSGLFDRTEAEEAIAAVEGACSRSRDTQTGGARRLTAGRRRAYRRPTSFISLTVRPSGGVHAPRSGDWTTFRRPRGRGTGGGICVCASRPTDGLVPTGAGGSPDQCTSSGRTPNREGPMEMKTAGALHRSLLDHPRVCRVDRPARRPSRTGSSPSPSTSRSLPRFSSPPRRSGIGTPFVFLYALHDALIKPLPGNDMAPVPGRVLEGEPGRAGVRVQAPRGPAVSQRGSLHRRGREVELPPLPGHRGQAAARPGEGRGDRRSTPRAIRAARALAGLSRVLCHSGHRRRLDRAQEVHRKGRRGDLQATTGRARALSVRASDARCRAGARRQRAVLAQEAVRSSASSSRACPTGRRAWPC